jgi:histidinol-phosphate aminotransferase
MPVSRRSFLGALKPGTAALSPVFIAARGREAATAGATNPAPDTASPILLDSNENPLGPGPVAMDALTRAFVDAGRYPSNARPSMTDLRAAIAKRVSVAPENIALGAGSWEILRTSVRLFTSSSRHLVTAAPSFENPEKMAEQLGVGVRKVPVAKDGRLDLEGMAQAAKWAGLVFFCNPNNPTSTLHPAKAVAEFVARVHKESPDTTILIDEAYHDYVTDPAYATAVPLALENPNVIVARTLSKAYGMAGMRVGYAVGEKRTIENFNRWAITFNQNSLAVAAAIAALGDPAHIEAERARNTEARAFTTRFFTDLGYKVMDSQTNFVFVETGRHAKDFKEACAKRGLMVGRPFPPLETRFARVSIGTIEEMQKAGPVIAEVLRGEGPARASTSQSQER